VNDLQFLVALESCRLAESEFGHKAHVRAAYLYLRAGDFATALGRMRQAIRKYAAHLGKPERYHETITVAYLSLIARHLWERGDEGGWAGFASRNPELFEPDLLLRYYPKEQLESQVAREVFVLPGAASGSSRAEHPHGR
jgi:hypothetical protein